MDKKEWLVFLMDEYKDNLQEGQYLDYYEETLKDEIWDEHYSEIVSEFDNDEVDELKSDFRDEISEYIDYLEFSDEDIMVGGTL